MHILGKRVRYRLFHFEFSLRDSPGRYNVIERTAVAVCIITWTARRRSSAPRVVVRNGDDEHQTANSVRLADVALARGVQCIGRIVKALHACM